MSKSNDRPVDRWQGFRPEDRAWLLTRIAGGMLGAFGTIAIVLYLHDPSLAPRLGLTALLLTLTVGATHWLARRERVVAGAVVLLSGLLVVVTMNALQAGGITSPGIQAYFLFVILGGLLLGWRGAVGYALAIAAISGWLVYRQLHGALSPAIVAYDAVDRWYFVLLYTAVALFVVLAAERSQRRLVLALAKETEARTLALRQLETVLTVGGYGRFEHDIAASRFLPDPVVIAMTGLEPEADGRVSMAHWAERLHEDDRTRVEEMLAPVLRGHAEHVRITYRYRHPSHGVRHIDASLLLDRDEYGQPAGLVGLLLDLTPQQAVIEQLGERLKEMRLLYRAAHLLRGDVLDPATTLHRLVFAIPEAWQYPALTEARLTLGDMQLCTPGWTGLGPRIEVAIGAGSAGGTLMVEYRERPTTAQEIVFLAEEEELLAAVASLIASWCMAAEDRRRFRLIEERLQQAQRIEAVGTFASGMAHDFNNVLTAIIATAEGALDVPHIAGGDAGEDLTQIVAAARRGQALVQRIRRLGQRQTLDRTAVSLEALITEVVALARPSAPAGVTLDVHCDPDVPLAWADAGQLHQVLLNLLANAFHATRDSSGAVTIRLTAGPREGSAGHEERDCLITIADSGVGMPASVVARIFEPFFTTKGDQGTGLGLSMVYGILHDHDGSIHVESRPGEGTTFVLRIPAARPSASMHSPTEEPPEAPEVPRLPPGVRVLMVDDDAFLLRLLCTQLEQSGIVCVASTNPREIIQHFTAAPHEADVVLSDMHMPEMSGLDLIRQLRTIRPELPAVLCSGANPAGVAELLDEERIGWVSKPPRREELISALGRAVVAPHAAQQLPRLATPSEALSRSS